MQVADVLAMEIDQTLQNDDTLTVQIVSVGELRGANKNVLPIMLVDDSGELWAGWVNPTETRWQELKGTTATIKPVQFQGKWSGAQRGEYNGKPKFTIFGPALQYDPETKPERKSNGRPYQSKSAPRHHTGEEDVFTFQRKALSKIVEACRNLSLDLTTPGAVQGVLASLNTLMIAFNDGRIDLAPDEQDTTVPTHTSTDSPLFDESNPDDDIPF